MIRYRSHSNAIPRRTPACLAVLSAAMLLGGCASGSLSSDNAILSMFVDPSRYDIFDCAQLRTAKRDQQQRISDLEALMAKAQTGAGGGAIAEVAYRGDYNKARANYNLADKVWQRNKCDSERLPPEKLAGPGKPAARDPLLPPAPYEEPAPVDQIYRR